MVFRRRSSKKTKAMEGEVQTKTPQENGAKLEDKTEEVKPPEKEEIKTAKTKSSPATRSRSRTPQITKDGKNEDPKPKKEDKKQAGTSLKKIEEETSNVQGERKSRRSEKQEKKEKKDKNKEEVPVENDKAVDDGVKKDETKKDEEVVESVETKEVKRSSPRKREKQEDAEAKNKPSESDVVEAEASAPKTNDAVPKTDGEDMEPLVLPVDEPDPELQFDETSDQESGGGSPLVTRCKTRRSHTRNIPTPKTPKSVDSDSDKYSIPPISEHLDAESTKTENLNDTNDSFGVVGAEDVSTRVEVGSDVTRLNYMTDNESIIGDDQAYLDSVREKSLRDTLRNLSPRRPIRSSGIDSFRVRTLKNNQSKSSFFWNNSDHHHLTATKRKRRSISPDDRKKFKTELPTSGFLSSTFRGWFLAEPTSSTPKLTAYKDESKDIHEEIKEADGDSSNKKSAGCSVM